MLGHVQVDYSALNSVVSVKPTFYLSVPVQWSCKALNQVKTPKKIHNTTLQDQKPLRRDIVKLVVKVDRSEENHVVKFPYASVA